MSSKSPSSSATLSTQVLSALKWSYLSVIIQAVSRIFILSVLSQLLSPSDFGLVGIALIFTSFAERVGQIGVGPALVQRKELPDEYLRTGTFISLVTGFIIFAALFTLAPFIADFFENQQVSAILRAVSTIFLVEGVSVIPDCLLQRQLHFKALMAVENISYFVGSGAIAIGLALSGFGVWSLVIGLVASRIIKLVLLSRYIRLDLKISFSFSACKELLTTGVGYSLGRVLSFAAVQGDNFVVGKLLGVTPLGLYSRSYQMMTIPAVYFGNVLERVLFPAMAKKQRDTESLRRVFLYSIELVSLFVMPTTVFMYLTSEEIIYTLFGKSWNEAIPVLEILSLGVFFRTAYKSSDTLLRALGAVYRHAVRQFIYSAFVIGGAVIGAVYNGLNGVAWAVLLAVFVNYMLMTSLSRSLLAVSFSDFAKAHLLGAWISIFVGSGLVALLPYLRMQFGWSVLILLAAGAVSFCTGFAALWVSPAVCRLSSLSWMYSKINTDKLGKKGAIVRKIFSKCAV